MMQCLYTKPAKPASMPPNQARDPSANVTWLAPIRARKMRHMAEDAPHADWQSVRDMILSAAERAPDHSPR